MIEQAKIVGSATLMDAIISEMVQSLHTVMDEVTAKLPQGFPEEIAAPIMQGIQEATKNLQL